MVRDEAAPRVTVVIPAYNEAPVIGPLVLQTLSDIASRLPGTELIVVDDGSTDGTRAVLLAISDGRPHLRCLRMERNIGQGPALYRGFESSRGEWICHMDGDGQVLPSDFWGLWGCRHDGDLLLGVRRDRQDPVHRRLLTRAVRLATRLASGRPLEDAAAPLRLMRRGMWEDVRRYVDDSAISLSILVSVAAARRGWRVREIPVQHRERVHGASHLRGLRLVRFIARGGYELTVLTVRLRRAGFAAASASLADR